MRLCYGDIINLDLRFGISICTYPTNGNGELTSIVEPVQKKNEFGTFVFPNPASNTINIILSPEPVSSLHWMNH
jgi:hypothetical protein